MRFRSTLVRQFFIRRGGNVVFRCRLPKVLGFVAIAVVYHLFDWTVFVS